MFFPLSRTTRKTNATLLQVDRTQKPRGSGGSVLIAFKKKFANATTTGRGGGGFFSARTTLAPQTGVVFPFRSF